MARKCVRRKRVTVKGHVKRVCAKYSGSKRRLRRKKGKKCVNGVNKITGKCLKHKRRK